MREKEEYYRLYEVLKELRREKETFKTPPIAKSVPAHREIEIARKAEVSMLKIPSPTKRIITYTNTWALLNFVNKPSEWNRSSQWQNQTEE
jgi:hypothetical protein